MGLLDVFQSPEGMQALSLLSAAGPSMEPQNLAGRLGMAGRNYQGLLGDQLKQQLTKAQLGEYATKNQLEQLQLQRLQDWRTMTTGQGASPAPQVMGSPQITPTESIGGVVPRLGGPMMTSPAPAGDGAQAPGQSQGSGFPFPLRGMSDAQTRAIASSMSPEKYMEVFANQSAPGTDIEKLMAAQGISKDSPLGRQLLQTATAKLNYTAPVNARPGSILRDPFTNKPLAYNPHIPDGSMPLFDASGNVTSIQPINGAYPAMSAAAAATELGKGEATPTVAYDASGNPVFSTKATDVRRAGGGMPGVVPPVGSPGHPVVSAGDQKARDAEAIPYLKAELAKPGLPADQRAGLEKELARVTASQSQDGFPTPSLTPQQRPGMVEGAKLGQDELSKKGAALMADNGQTNTVISRLQNIKMLAPGAIAGAESSRRDYFNGLLALAGLKGAEDSKTASDLVDKNQAQIVSALRMGQGGAGTDALQTLLASANPNRHMTKEAITEAADQLIASQKMVQDKAKVLQSHYLGRDPVSYGSKELQFDQNADPRIWQLHSMTPQQQAAYVKSLPAGVAADLQKKRQALKQLGVF